MKKQKALGVIGGFGPESTADFYLKLIEKSLKKGDQYPEIFIYNTPITFKIEKKFIKDNTGKSDYIKYIRSGIKQLEKIDTIKYYVIPCNSLHVFLDDIKKTTKKPFINIVDESVSFLKKQGFKKVGILSTKATLESEIYQKTLSNNNIKLISPTKLEQQKISNIILNILGNKKTIQDKKILLSIIKNFKKKQCDCVLLACTDLEILLQEELSKKDYVFDTLEILVKSTFDYLNN